MSQLRRGIYQLNSAGEKANLGKFSISNVIRLDKLNSELVLIRKGAVGIRYIDR